MHVAERIEQVRTRCTEVIAKIRNEYGIDCSDVTISFNLRGRTAGWAGCKRPMFGGAGSDFFVRFNVDMIAGDSFDHIINDTVPHEFAHIVCYKRPELGRNHDQGWKNVCWTLGGSAKRCHNEQVVFAKGRTFQYLTTIGILHTVSEKIHRKIQTGAAYRIRNGGKLDKTCKWALFGQPINFAIAETPAAPVEVSQPKVTTPKTAPAGTSNATLVREFIRIAKRNNQTQKDVVSLCIDQLGMTRALAATYVKNNWEKV